MIASLRSALYGSVGKKAKNETTIAPIPTGLSLFDRALGGGIKAGSVISVLGTAGSGRSTFGLSLIAEVARALPDYDLFLHETECQYTDLSSYLPDYIASRIHRVDAYFGGEREGVWRYISMLRTPFIYVLDSLEGLLAESSTTTNNNEATSVFDRVRKTKSILVITSTKQAVEGKPVFVGGYALRFYADYCFSLLNKGERYKVIRGKRRSVGTNTAIKIDNAPGTIHSPTETPAPIEINYGYSDEGSLFEFLREVGQINIGKRRGWYEYPMYQAYGPREKIEAVISENKREILDGLDTFS